MMNPLNQVFGTGTRTPTTEHVSTIDVLWVQGAARTRLHRRFGTEALNALETLSEADQWTVNVGIATEKGSRPRNEDSALVMLARLATGRDPVPIVLAAVADGMGGHADGDKASAITLETLTDYMADHFLQIGSQPTMLPISKTIEDMLTEAVTQAHFAVRAETPEGGSTLTCLLMAGSGVYIAHIGDSRAYLVRGGSIDVLTRDHLVVRHLQEAGVITPQEAEHHPQGHVLYRAIGMDEGFEVDIASRRLRPNSRLLLCTDGVWGALSANDIYARVMGSEHPQVSCERLIRDALERRSSDNGTAVLIQLPDDWR